jgi:superfamily I DNA and/or RNA helicase
MSSGSFIAKLLMRLKSGDARSIHLNALPGNFARLDLYDLVNIEPSMHLRFLHDLLNKKSFRFSITLDPSLLNDREEKDSNTDRKKILQKLVKRLNHLDYQEKEEYSEHGYHSFGFGYPLLIKRDPNNTDRILKAPILIWYLTIEKDHKRNNTWTISRNEEHPLIFNELLESHFENAEEIKTDDLDEYIEDDFIDEPRLISLCRKLLEKLNVPFDEKETIATVLPSTNKETIENITKASPWIRWSGIFGLYKMQKQSIIKDLESLPENELISDARFEEEFFDGEVLTPIFLDPSQENVLQQLKHTNTVIIQGPPGTGKSQSLTAIITQALLNRQKVLVVCEKRTAMEVLYNNLKKENLHHLCALIEDVYADRKHIVELVRNIVESAGQQLSRFRNNEYELLRSRFLTLQEEINHRINFTAHQVFGDDNWLELIAKSFEINKNKEILEKANSIHKLVRNSDYRFMYDEYNTMLEKIQNSNDLFRSVDEKALLFDELNDLVFKNDSPVKIFTDIKKMYEESVRIEKEIKSNIARYGSQYYNLHGFGFSWMKVWRLLVSKYKRIRIEQNNAITSYNQLKELIHKQNYFPIDIKGTQDLQNMNSLIPDLQKIQLQTQKFLEQEIHFKNYSTFRKFFIQLPASVQALVRAMVSIVADDWIPVFSSYYFNQVILKKAMENGIKDDSPKLLSEIEQTDVLLKQKLSEKINHSWQEIVADMVRNKDLTEIKYLYNQRKNKVFSSRNSLRKIIHKDFDFFTTLFPVIMVNPSAATSILPLQQNLFDLIILDEASQLRLEDTFSSLVRGRTKIISGDKHQMPPSNFFGNEVVFWNEVEDDETAHDFLAESKSLLEYADDADYKNSYLDFHYRSLHPGLIDFSNHAFYGSRLVPMPEKEEYQAIHHIPVDGMYGEGVNADEAREVVRFIYSLEKTTDEYPSVGIATFNIYQRDLIYDELYEQAYADKEKNDKLQALLNNGLFVKNLENIQGDERDIMILSTTFGRDVHGKFRQSFGPLTQEKGYQLLNVIITRAKHSLYVFTSIPEAVFMNFSEQLAQKGNTGKGIFYAYLAYVKACSEEDDSQKEFIRHILQKNSRQVIQKNQVSQSFFVKCVFDELRGQFGEDIHQNYKLGGFILDIVLLKDGRPLVYLDFETPGKYLPDVSYRIKLHRQKMAASRGIQAYHLWSYTWWRNTGQEIQAIRELYDSL